MAKSSVLTKKYRTIYWVLRSIDLILLWAPLIIYFIVALCDTGVTTNKKIGLVASVIVALILVLFNIIARHHLTSPLWIVLIGLYIAIDYLLPLVIIIACVTIADEFVFQPYLKKLTTRLEASKVYDKQKAAEETVSE